MEEWLFVGRMKKGGSLGKGKLKVKRNVRLAGRGSSKEKRLKGEDLKLKESTVRMNIEHSV